MKKLPRERKSQAITHKKRESEWTKINLNAFENVFLCSILEDYNTGPRLSRKF